MRNKEGNIPRGEIKFNAGRMMKSSKTNLLKSNKAHTHLAKPQRKQFEAIHPKKLLRSQIQNAKKMVEMNEKDEVSQIRAIRELTS
mmetsp:Transcript_4600/g.7801  ORF Transcript_4600/g.7801 Transcript_4600/m.7801 type:complete len:86 (-) Transcript_4600:58-315(-)